MKKLFTLISISVLMISCQITERVFIQESGMVRYENEFNFSEMVGMVFSKSQKDSLRQKGEFPIDSVMKLSDLEKFEDKMGEGDNKARQEFMNALEGMTARIVINDNEGKMVFGVEKKDVKTFNTYMQRVKNAAEKLYLEDRESAQNLSQTGLLKSLRFDYDAKTFQRISGNEMSKIFEGVEDSLADDNRQMLELFTYKMEYHFPKKVEKSSIENAKFSLDGKVMTVETSMLEMIENPDKYNFKVEF